jgi:hypothetical protein
MIYAFYLGTVTITSLTLIFGNLFMQLLTFWTLSMVLFFLAAFRKLDSCLRRQVKAYTVGPIDRASPISGRQNQHKTGYISRI